MKYTKIHMNLLGLITPWGFLGERYFFKFTDIATWKIKAYTGKDKSKWFGHLRMYYTPVQIVSQNNCPVYHILTDFSSELQTIAIDQ